jgi:L-iditol 2-dehydrogenase
VDADIVWDIIQNKLPALEKQVNDFLGAWRGRVLMKAVYLTGIRRVEVREAAPPGLEGPDDVLLRIHSVGVCGSDIHYYTQGRIGSQVVQFPFIIGHECAGTVMETAANVSGLRTGQRVAIDPLVACGYCDQCRAGRKHTCRNQKFLGIPGQLSGALCEFLSLPAECCYPIPDSVSLAQAVVVEPFSIGLHAVRLAELPRGACIGILGVGPIGLCVLLAARVLAGCKVYATDLLDYRLSLAHRCGAHWVGNPRGQDIVRAIAELEPLGLDCVFECAGEQEAFDQALELLKPGGTLSIVCIPEAERISFTMEQFRRKELRVQNVRRQNQCVTAAIEMIASGAVNVDPLVTHHFPIADAAEAFKLVAARQGGVVKAIINVVPES